MVYDLVDDCHEVLNYTFPCDEFGHFLVFIELYPSLPPFVENANELFASPLLFIEGCHIDELPTIISESMAGKALAKA